MGTSKFSKKPKVAIKRILAVTALFSGAVFFLPWACDQGHPTSPGQPTTTATPAVIFTPVLVPMTILPLSKNPYGVAVDPRNDHVVVAEGTQIQVLDSSGNSVTIFGSSGTGPGQLNHAYGVAVDGQGNIYVSDSWNNRVQLFNSSYNLVTQWGDSAPNPGNSFNDFNDPLFLALSPADGIHPSVFVADYGNDRVQQLAHTGTGHLSLTGFRVFTGPEQGIDGVAVDSTRNIYVTDNAFDTVYKFDSRGRPVTQWLAPEDIIPGADAVIYRGITLEPVSGDFYVVCGGQYGEPPGMVRHFDRFGKYLEDFVPASGNFGDAIGITIDSAKNIYVSDWGNECLYKFSR